MRNEIINNISFLYDEAQIFNALVLLKENIYEQSFRNNEVLEKLSHKFYLYGNVLALHHGGNIKGVCAFYANDTETWTAYLSIIVVAHDMQGNGCGTALLMRMLEVCKQHGMRKLRLEVSDSNTKAIRFYSKHGFSLEKHLETSSYFVRSIDAKQ